MSPSSDTSNDRGPSVGTSRSGEADASTEECANRVIVDAEHLREVIYECARVVEYRGWQMRQPHDLPGITGDHLMRASAGRVSHLTAEGRTTEPNAHWSANIVTKAYEDPSASNLKQRRSRQLRLRRSCCTRDSSLHLLRFTRDEHVLLVTEV